MRADQYQCAICKEIFDKGRSDEEALDEFKDRIERFRDVPNETITQNCGLVCDDCYNVMVKEGDIESADDMAAADLELIRPR